MIATNFVALDPYEQCHLHAKNEEQGLEKKKNIYIKI